MNFLGSSEKFALFSLDGYTVAVDIEANEVAELSSSAVLASLEGSLSGVEVSDVVSATARQALESVIAGANENDRMYTIPGGVQAEAKKALEWRKEEKRGGTPVGINTARILAKGGQIGIKKIRHIARYFPRHEVDKKGRGWKPGTSEFPSNGRIAWALWGGDAAWRWAETIVERENKKALAASGYEIPTDSIIQPATYSSDINPFKLAHELDLNAGPEFMARVRLDGSGIDRLYKIDIDGKVAVWDDCGWDTLGHVDGDVYTYDAALDDPYDTCEKDYVIIDPSSAVVISAFLQERPFQPVAIDEIDPEESEIVYNGLAEEDFAMIDRVITAAGPAAPSSEKSADGEYTPEERAENVKAQPRDAKGLFVKVGAKTIVGGDPVRGQGTITSINEDRGTVSVRLDNGKTVEVNPKHTEAAGPNLKSGQQLVPNNEQRPLDLSGIIGEPRTPHDQPKAHLPGTMKPLTDKQIQLMISDFPKYVQEMRASYKPRNAADKARVQKDWGKDVASDFAVTAAGEEAVQTPKTSDVPAKYLAIVSPDDTTAVMDLVAIVPKTVTTTEPMLYARVDGEWVPSEQILNDLKSATPPDVVELDDKEVLNDVLLQMDKKAPVMASATYDFNQFWNSVVDPLLAAGGLDRNRGNAEELRQYWTRGKGAAKIRWGTPGDWTRCVRNLSKYMGVRAKGYCQLRHKEATGVYTGSRFNPGNRDSLTSSMFASESELVEKVIAKSALTARAADARQKIGLVASAPRAEHGARFTIPLLLPEELESGDGRSFKKDAISLRELPLPLLWQIKTGDGHAGSVVVGRIDYVERTERGMGNAFGVFDSGVYGQEAERLVRNGFLRGVSADLDQFEAKEQKREKPEAVGSAELEEANEIGKDKLVVNKARVMAATIVAKPAFQECTIFIDESGDQEDSMTPTDGIYEESVEFSTVEPITASGFLAEEIPVTPPQEWFENPKLTKPTPMTIEPNGKIYGHIAAWHVNHIGMPRSTRPPRSKSKYSYFHTGVVRTDSGKDMPVGQLTLAGGHANLSASAAQAAKHYDDTASAIADVHAGEDEYGIWVSGSLRPDATEAQIRALRASAPSGDWRPINGSLELVAVCQVNVPGFPIARAMVASGKVMALVAAGANYMAVLQSETVNHFADKALRLAELSAGVPDLKSRVKAAKKSARQYAITAAATKVDEFRERALTAAAIAELAQVSEEERKALAEESLALPDGSYPIRDEKDLKNAIRAYGRSNPKDRAKVRAHIRKRARALKLAMLVPEEWKSAGSIEAANSVETMRASITAALSTAAELNDAALEVEEPETFELSTSEYFSTVINQASEEADPKASSYPALTADAVSEFAEVAEEISEADLKKLKEAKEEADKQTEEEIQRAEDIAAGKTNVEDKYDQEGRMKYVSGVNQPRDAKGKYRKVLARLKQNLGVAGLQDALKKVEDAEGMDFAGNYAESAKASEELLGMIDRIDTNALNPKALENVKATAAELGKVIANLPLPFGKEAEKVRFSDLPAGLKTLIESMIDRVEAKIGKEDADIATKNLRSYMSGADVYSQGEVQSEMSKLLRLLT